MRSRDIRFVRVSIVVQLGKEAIPTSGGPSSG